MDYSARLAMSYYKDIAVINESHNIHLVQHLSTGKIYVKKELEVFNAEIYQFLKYNPIPGTPRIIDCFVAGDNLVVIEEYISGDSLSDLMSAHQLTIEKIAKYMITLCDTIHILHTQNPPIIHRDIKPSNIIIAKGDYAVLLDFNAAKYFKDRNVDDTVLLGTQGYAAPEQYGFGSSSAQTDIYSLGVLLREMVATLPPNEGKQFSNIIKKCTQMDPADRYKSAHHLKEAFLSFVDISYRQDPEKVNAHYFPILPPGFRTLTPWKMLIATPIYAFLSWFALSFEVEDTTLPEIWFERVYVLATLLFLIAFTGNYRNIQASFPLCNSRKLHIRIFGVILFDIILGLLLFVLLMVIDLAIFNTSPL